MRVDIIILAAGQGSRMKSRIPKVLHAIAGRPMLEHVVLCAKSTLEQFEEGQIHLVVGYGADAVKKTMKNHDLNFVTQDEQFGTGHAVQKVLPYCKGADIVLVLYGDVPLISSLTLHHLLTHSNTKFLGLLTTNLTNPAGYGRIIRDKSGNIVSIVEDKDADSAQLAIKEVNTGIMAIPGSRIAQWVSMLQNNNLQQQFYLTDIVAMSVQEGIPVINTQPQDVLEVKGVNSRIELVELERMHQGALVKRLMADGVSIADPQRLDIRGTIKTGYDVTIDVNVILEGDVKLADNVSIGPGCVIRNSQIGVGTSIKAYSIIEGAVIEEACVVGPFARLRPGTKLEKNALVGNFVEVKKSHIGVGSKISHLSYVGDAELGKNVNIGAGTITCNYDGVNKHVTTIGDNAFIGSNSSLVAPVEIGIGATTAAGSTITQGIPAEQLGVARGRQKNIEGWQRPIKEELDQ